MAILHVLKKIMCSLLCLLMIGASTVMYAPSSLFADNLEQEVRQLIGDKDPASFIKVFKKEAKKDKKDADPMVKLGLTYGRIGEWDEAFKTFAQAVARDDNNVAAHYYLGMCALKLKAYEITIKAFDTILERAPEGFYGQQVKANQATLESMRKNVPLLRQAQRRIIKEEKKKKRLTLSGRFGYQYDTNGLYERQTGGPRAERDNTLSGRVKAHYKLIEGEKYRLSATYLYSQSFHLSHRKLDVMSHVTSLNLYRYFKDTPFFIDRIGLETTHNMLFIDENFYKWSQDIEESIRFKFIKRMSHTFYHKFGFANYNEDSSNPGRLSKDRTAHSVGLKNFFFLPRRMYCYVMYDYTWANARGTNYDNYSHTVSYGYHAPLFWEVDLDLSGSFSYDDYTKDATNPKRRDSKQRYTVALSRPISKHWEVKTSYTLADSDSTNKSNSYRNNTVKTEFSFKY
jgi:tetratricopeptide (TPR) repeat protein